MWERIGKLNYNCREILSQNSTKEGRITNEIKCAKVNENKIEFKVVPKRYE